MASNKEEDLSQEVQIKPAEDVDAFPDGGLRAWTVVLGGWCLLFVSSGWINCKTPPLHLPPVMLIIDSF